MKLSRRYPSRLLLALAAAVAVLVIGAATAWGQTGPSNSPSTGGGVSGSSGSGVSVSSGTVDVGSAGTVSSGIATAWCCGTTGAVPGLTVVGQATVDGQDTAARDTAIAKAVQDATDQAQTAAGAAGIQLGAIVDLEVSAMPFFTPMMGGASGSSPGSPGGGTVEPMQYQSSVSVTVTWALGEA